MLLSLEGETGDAALELKEDASLLVAKMVSK